MSCPGGDRLRAVAKYPCSCSNIKPFGQRREDFPDALRCRFEPVERGIASSTKRGRASLAAEGLDPLVLGVGPIADQGRELRVGDPIVRAGAVGAGKALGSDPAHGAAATFQLTPGHHWHGCRGLWRRERCLLAADRAVVRRARLEQPLDGRSGKGGTILGVLVRPPNPGQPNQPDREQEHEPLAGDRHRQPDTMGCE